MALKWLHSKRDVGGKLARWILALQEFDIDIKHLKGDFNVVADTLSRFPVGAPETTDPTERMVCSLTCNFYPPKEIALMQQGDPSLRSIILRLRENPVDGEYLLYQHCLFKKNRRSGLKRLLVVPSFLRREILHACHDMPTGGHMGVEKNVCKSGRALLVAWNATECGCLRLCLYSLPAEQAAAGPPDWPAHVDSPAI